MSNIGNNDGNCDMPSNRLVVGLGGDQLNWLISIGKPLM